MSLHMKTAILKSSVVGVMLTAGAFFCEAGPWEVRAVQLDLARQMETVPFVKGYLTPDEMREVVAAAYFGDPRGREQMLQPKRGAPRCVMELSLKEEFGE